MRQGSLRSQRPTSHQPVDDRQDARRVSAARPISRHNRRHPGPAGSQDPVPSQWRGPPALVDARHDLQRCRDTRFPQPVRHAEAGRCHHHRHAGRRPDGSHDADLAEAGRRSRDRHCRPWRPDQHAHHGGSSLMKTVLVTDHVFPNLDPENAVLEGIGMLREAGSVKDAELLELARDADAVLNCYRPLSADIVEAMKNCRIIARYGIGVDTIPLEVATSRGIQVTNVPDYCIEEVADHGLALILALTRGIIPRLDHTRGGGWYTKFVRPLHRPRGHTLRLDWFGRLPPAPVPTPTVPG